MKIEPNKIIANENKFRLRPNKDVYKMLEKITTTVKKGERFPVNTSVNGTRRNNKVILVFQKNTKTQIPWVIVARKHLKLCGKKMYETDEIREQV